MRFLAGLCPDPLGKLECFPRTPSSYFQEKRREGQGKVKGNGSEGKRRQGMRRQEKREYHSVNIYSAILHETFNFYHIRYAFNAFVMQHKNRFLNTSQDSAATYLWRCGTCYVILVANFLLFQ